MPSVVRVFYRLNPTTGERTPELWVELTYDNDINNDYNRIESPSLSFSSPTPPSLSLDDTNPIVEDCKLKELKRLRRSTARAINRSQRIPRLNHRTNNRR